MRSIALAAVVLTTACTSDPDIGFTLVSSLPAATDGLAVSDDAVASAAMDGQLCQLSIADAAVIGDQDLGAGDETLLDSLDRTALVAHGDGLFTLPRALDAVATRVELAPARTARLYADGVVGLHDRDGQCGVSWSEAPAAMWLLPELSCDGAVGFAVDRPTGTAWIADGQRLARVSIDGRTATWAIPADRVVLDRGTGHVLVGATGGDWLGALGPDGALVWERHLDGELVDFDPAGTSGMTAVMVGDAQGGLLEIAASATGLPLAEFALPETAEVAMSEDGSTMAVVRDEEVLFYRVDADDGLLESANDDLAKAPDRSGTATVLAGAAGGATAVLGTAVLVAAMAD